jgi:hypothetical protein
MMKWAECVGAYGAYISLGSTCQTAYQLKRLGLRRFAGPLDWFVSESVPGLVGLIRSRFNGFMELNNIQLIGYTQDCYIARDNACEIVSYHDFPQTLSIFNWQEAYPELIERVRRRANRFLEMVKNHPVFFVRTQLTAEEALLLQSALQPLTHEESRLLVLNEHPADSGGIVFEDWGLDGICSASVPTEEDWRGSDRVWDQVMDGFRLAATP